MIRVAEWAILNFVQMLSWLSNAVTQRFNVNSSQHFGDLFGY